MSEPMNRTTPRTTKIISAMIIAMAVLIVFTMGHHPSGVHGKGGLAQWIHGLMMIWLSGLFCALAWVFIQRGAQRVFVMFGLVAYSVSFAAHIGAATLNGFVVPALARRGQEAVSHDVFLLCWEFNQALAGLGVFATGFAYAFWGVHLMRLDGVGTRLAGGLAMIAGLVPMALLGFDVVNMNVSGALIIYALHMVWPIVFAVTVWKRATS